MRKVFGNRKVASKIVSRRVTKKVGMPDLTHCLAHHKFNLQPVKVDGFKKQFGVLPTRSVTTIQTAVWTLNLAEGPVKLGEPSDHSACHRVYRRVRLTSPNRRKLNRIPFNTTKDIHGEEATVDESDAKIDEEQIEMQEVSIYRDLSALNMAERNLGDIDVTEEIFIGATLQASMAVTLFVDRSGADTSEVTQGTDAQVQIDTSGTKAPTDGETT
uniref:Polyprotein protein n=1 Tax=Solanum tuberosum TaxID=4113 RepID=M1DVR1_SOLTU